MHPMKQALVALALCLGLSAAALAQEGPTAEQVVKSTTDQVLATLEANKDKVKENPQAVIPLVREIVLPHFDFQQMSQLVLGRHWRSASPEQRERFSDEFRELLIRTYGNALKEYSGQKVEFLPSRPSKSPDRATVRTSIIQPSGPAVPVVYELRRGEEGWKVIDVVVNSVSLVLQYRTDYNAVIGQVGIDGLIERMQQQRGGQG